MIVVVVDLSKLLTFQKYRRGKVWSVNTLSTKQKRGLNKSAHSKKCALKKMRTQKNAHSKKCALKKMRTQQKCGLNQSADSTKVRTQQNINEGKFGASTH